MIPDAAVEAAATDAMANVWDAAYRRGIDDILMGESNTPATNPYRPAK